MTFDKLLIVFSTKVNLLYLPYSTAWVCCLPNIFRKFPFKNYLKKHNIPVTPKLVKKAITKVDMSKTPGRDCIPVVALKNCESEFSWVLSCIHTEPLNMYAKESSIYDCWKVSAVVPEFKMPVFKNVGDYSRVAASVFTIFSK